MPIPPPSLVILAAGRSRRYGRLKQLDPIGPGGAALLDYSIYDAVEAGFGSIVIVVAQGREPEFDEHLEAPRRAGIDIRLAVQDDRGPLVDPRWASVRQKPWGTGYALLCARGSVTGAFGVCNADDFYGAGAFETLVEALGRGGPAACIVPFLLRETLSERGGVSRGLCRVSDEGRLLDIHEGLELRRSDEVDASAVVGVDVRGHALTTSLDAPVSMNLWGFQPTVWPLLGAGFEEFLAGSPGEEDEFYLSEFVGRAIDRGLVACDVLPAGSGWLGVTFPGDRAPVAEALAKRTESRPYPPRLWGPTTPETGGDECS